MNDIGDIPQEVYDIYQRLEDAGYEAYFVGGCVRDLINKKEPHDWDIATNARPDDILKVFPDSVYENNFGTVGVKTEHEQFPIVEVTTYRTESTYSDFRRPDEISFADTIEQDLSRRDFTMNAIAARIEGDTIVFKDPYKGKEDLAQSILRCVGEAEERFKEDALRMMRAVRFAAQLDVQIEKKTEQALMRYASLLSHIAKERIRDEFVKILLSDRAAWGVEALRIYGLLKYSIPELLEGVGVEQNKHHIYTVWEHNLRALDYAAQKNYSLQIRLGALLHDVGKPRTKEGDGENSTFYNHEVVGAKMTRYIMKRLGFSKKDIQHVSHLVRHHLFYYNVGEVSEAGVRRFLSRVGVEYIDDLMKIREADRIGSGVPKAVPYKLRHLRFMIEKVRRDPLSPKMLAIDGSDLMKQGVTPGPRMGMILAILLEDILDDPSHNTKDYLLKKAKELNTLSDTELKEKEAKAQEKKNEWEEGIEKEMRKKYNI